MKKLLFSILLFLSLGVATAQPVTTAYRQRFINNDLYHYNFTTISPVFAGLDGSKITFMGSTFDPRTGDRVSSGFLSYEGKIDKINSGFGVNVDMTQNERGSSFDVATQTYINLLYNYQIRIGEQQKIVIGAKVTHFQFNYIPFNFFGPPYEIYDYETRSNVQFGGAALYKAGKFFAGMSMDNIAKKPVFDRVVDTLVFKPMLHYFAGFNVKYSERLAMIHSAYLYWFNYSWRLDVNNSLLIKKRTILGLTIRKNDFNNEIIPVFNFGMKFKEQGQAVMTLYSKERDVQKFFSGQLLLEFKI